MINLSACRILTGFLGLTAVLLSVSVHAQQYKTMADTTRLNKEYGEVSLEISKLNSKLIAERNKTADYRAKTSSTASEAASSGQASMDQAATATSGNTKDTKQAVKDAKKADRKANHAKDAVSDEKDNAKKINELTAQIDQKQKILRDLDAQRAAIMGSAMPITTTIIDSTVHNP